MVRDRLLGDRSSGGQLVEWLRERWDEGPRRSTPRGTPLEEGKESQDATADSDVDANATDRSPEGSRAAPDGGSPPAWEDDDPISFDDADDGQSLLEAVTAASEDADTTVDLEAELRDAATDDGTPPDELLEESTRGASRRAESTSDSPDDQSETDLSWNEAVEQLVDAEADVDAPAPRDVTADGAASAEDVPADDAASADPDEPAEQSEAAVAAAETDGNDEIAAEDDAEATSDDRDGVRYQTVDETDTEPASPGKRGETEQKDEADGAGETDETDEADEPAEAGGGDDTDTSQLHDRIESIESEHEQVSTSVSSLETELDELRGDVNGIRTDLGTLVDLVKQAGHTRGAAAAQAAETTAESPTASETDAPTPARRDGSPESPETQEEQAAASRDSTTEQSSTAASAADQTDGAAGSESETAERASDVDGREADGREADGRETDEPSTVERAADDVSDDRSADERRPEQSTAEDDAARDVVDPRSDAVGTRLLEYRKQFGGDGPAASEATVAAATAGGDDEPPAAGFQFQKLLVPADGDGEPELIGEDLRQPYLEDLPSGYAAEALVIEWLDGLVSQADQETAVQALGYYQSIGWIGASVRHTLVGYLSGLGEIDEDELPDAPPAALDMSDHRRTLEYVTHLATGEVSDDGI